MSVDPLLLTTVRLLTYTGGAALTGATGFFFQRDSRLFLVTSRHVLVDAPTGHHPDRIEITLHTSRVLLQETVVMSILLYQNGLGVWRSGTDAGGEIDVAVLEIDRSALPASTVLEAFSPEHLLVAPEPVEIGTPLLTLGFPLGFYDTLHHLPVARQSVLASAFGIRFQGKGYFLTDARAHRGVSGAPVVMRDPQRHAGGLGWRLLGIHAMRLDMNSRDQVLDESLGLNCAWYADILLALTGSAA